MEGRSSTVRRYYDALEDFLKKEKRKEDSICRETYMSRELSQHARYCTLGNLRKEFIWLLAKVRNLPPRRDTLSLTPH